VSHLLDRLRKMTSKARRNVQGLSPDRADIIVPGITIIDRLMHHFHLNRVYLGHGAYGIEAAAQLYFGKSTKALSAAEATFLVVLVRGPAYYDPIKHRDRLLRRRQHVLSLLRKQNKLSEAQVTQLLSQPIEVTLHPQSFIAPHFVDWLLSETPREVRANGGVMHTTLDARLQRVLETRVAEHAKALRDRNVTDAGVVVLDSQTGAVLAMVGSGSYASAGGQVNIATWRRFPGSALKPFVYATAIESGDHPASVAFDVIDVPSVYRAASDTVEHGPVRYREALAGSYNLAAIHVLEKTGVARVMSKLRTAGVGELAGSEQDYGLRLALGATKVRLIDLASGYGFLVRAGRVVPAHAIDAVIADDNTAWRPPVVEDVRVFSPEVSYLVLDMLADPEARRPQFGPELPADLPYPVAVKTGTARGFADVVAVFVTREFTVAAWTGRFDGRPTDGVLGMRGAAPLARAALLSASRGADLT
jgi:penicillin-binding protein 1C